MGKRLTVILVALAFAALWAGPVAAQEAYPPPEDEDVLDVVDEQEPAAEDVDDAEDLDVAEEVEVEGVAVERERDGLPVTGATLAALTALGLGALAIGGTMLVVSRRRTAAR